ncbi:MAG: sugar phosphate isomerase/epimerase [Armatimonadetes bacterium]|nr:sugar phosphate isomerase/epimerase [Armatimonadota bacterium]
MRYATAIWNYAAADTPLAGTVNEFADFGYDTISFTTAHLVRLPERELRDAADVVAERDLAVTMHGNFEVTTRQVAQCIEPFGDRVLVVSCDAARRFEPRGLLYDTERMVPFMLEVLAVTEGTGARVAIEDFPLDESAVDAYREDLAPLLADPRYGILLDFGHMHIRLNQERYYADMDVREYIARAPLPVVEVHLHDNDGERDQHGHFGMGTVDFGEIAAGLRAIGFDGVSTLEIAPGIHGADREQSKPRSRESLEQWRTIWEEQS